MILRWTHWLWPKIEKFSDLFWLAYSNCTFKWSASHRDKQVFRKYSLAHRRKLNIFNVPLFQHWAAKATVWISTDNVSVKRAKVVALMKNNGLQLFVLHCSSVVSVPLLVTVYLNGNLWWHIGWYAQHKKLCSLFRATGFSFCSLFLSPRNDADRWHGNLFFARKVKWCACNSAFTTAEDLGV